MAWARVGSAALSSFGGAVTVTYTPTNGNLVVAVCSVSGSAPTFISVEDNHAVALTPIGVKNFTLAGAFGQMAAYAYLATGSPTSFVFTTSDSSTEPIALVVEFSGTTATTDGTFQAIEFNLTAAGSTGQPTYSSTASNELLLSFYGDDGNGNTITAPTGWTADPNNQTASSAQDIGIAWKNSTGGSETGAAWSVGTPGADGGVVLGAFQLPGGGGSTPPPPQPIPVQIIAEQYGLDWALYRTGPATAGQVVLQGSATGISPSAATAAGSGQPPPAPAVVPPDQLILAQLGLIDYLIAPAPRTATAAAGSAAAVSPTVATASGQQISPPILPSPIPAEFILAQFGLLYSLTPSPPAPTALQGSATSVAPSVAHAAGQGVSLGHAAGISPSVARATGQGISQGHAAGVSPSVSAATGQGVGQGGARTVTATVSRAAGQGMNLGGARTAAATVAHAAGLGIGLGSSIGVLHLVGLAAGQPQQTSGPPVIPPDQLILAQLGLIDYLIAPAPATNLIVVLQGSAAGVAPTVARASGQGVSAGTARTLAATVAHAAGQGVMLGTARAVTATVAHAAGQGVSAGSARTVTITVVRAGLQGVNLGGARTIATTVAKAAGQGVNRGAAVGFAASILQATGILIIPAGPVGPAQIPVELILLQYGLQPYLLQPTPIAGQVLLVATIVQAQPRLSTVEAQAR